MMKKQIKRHQAFLCLKNIIVLSVVRIRPLVVYMLQLLLMFKTVLHPDLLAIVFAQVSFTFAKTRRIMDSLRKMINGKTGVGNYVTLFILYGVRCAWFADQSPYMRPTVPYALYALCPTYLPYIRPWQYSAHLSHFLTSLLTVRTFCFRSGDTGNSV